MVSIVYSGGHRFKDVIILLLLYVNLRYFCYYFIRIIVYLGGHH